MNKLSNYTNLYKSKYRKYKNKIYNMQKMQGGFLCSPEIKPGDIEIMKSRLEYTGDPDTGFIKQDGTKIRNINFEYDNSGKKIIVGAGGIGKVYKGKETIKNGDEFINQSDVAIKIMKPPSEDLKYNFCSELLSLYEISHPNIMKYIGYAEHNGISYLFTELLNGYEMFEYIDKIINNKIINNIDEKFSIMKQLLEGLDFLHKNGIYHRDINLQNIFIIRDVYDNPIVKYIDFGLTCKLNFTCQFSNYKSGTPRFMSPEFANNISEKKENKDLYPYHDMWALGHALYILFTHKYLNRVIEPFIMTRIGFLEQDEIDKQIESISFPNDFPKEKSNIIINIIKDLLQVNYLLRKLDLSKLSQNQVPTQVPAK